MSKLINLKHLIVEECPTYPCGFPRGIGRLSSLTKLSHFYVGGKDDSQRCGLGELKYLNHLQGALTIYGLGNVVNACEAKNAELNKKIGLRDLCLDFIENGGRIEDGGRMETDVSVLNALEPPQGLEKLQIKHYWGTTMFPNWMMSLAKLKSFTLTGGLKLERLPPLGKLQFLEHLIIDGCTLAFKKLGVEFLGIESENKKEGIIKIFPNLKTLWFRVLYEWEEWIGIGGQEEEDCIIIMPCLQKLEICICPKLKSLPDFLFKTSLQEFEVIKSPILSERYQRGTGEDWAKISHIPNIKIDFIEVQREGQDVIRRDDEEEFDEEEPDEEEQSEDEELMNSPAGRITQIVYKGSHNHPKPQPQLAIKPAKESISDSEDQGSPCVVELTGPGDSENEDGVGDEPNLKKRTTYAVTEPKIIKQTRSEVCASNGSPRQASLVLSSFEDMLSWPKMWHKLTANPTTQAYLQNNDFVRMMHELHNNYLKDKRVIQALGVLLNINIWTPTSVDAEIPQSSSLLSLQPERKKSAETELAEELDLMELTADEGMDRESQACKEQEMGNAAYTKNDFDTAIAHYTKVMELDDGNISCLMNRAVAYLAIGQYDECIKDCDEVVERGRQLKSDSKMIAITLSRKGTALVKMAKHSQDYELAIETFKKALSEHCIPGTLKKLNDAEQAKRELGQQEYFDTKLANEEHEKGFKREPNLQLHRRGHNLSWKPSQGSVSTVDSSPPMPAPAQAQAQLAPPQSTGAISLVLPIKSPEETSENEIASEHHGMEIDIEEVKMTDSSEQKKFEIEEMGNDASQTRQPDVIQVEDMQLQASSTLKPQRVLFDVNAVNILKSSGLIQSQIEDVEMKSEASEQRGFFLMQGGLGLTMLPKDEDWKNAKEIYLMDNELSILPENPRCPNLSALFLPRNYKLRTIPPSFFDHMPALQILNLSRTSIKSLPDSIIKLVSLKRLFLNNCHRLMTLSPKVGDLKQLEVIDLEGAKIMDLPMEIKELTNLKYLEVSFYGYISNGNGKKAMQSNAVVPCGVISALSLLEELNIDVNPDDERWDARVEDIVTEICTLKRLETLKFYFPRVELLRHFQWNSLTLSYFRFTIGRHVKRIMSRVPCDVEFELERWGKCLKYINGVGVPGDIKKVLQHAVAFFLDRHATVKKLSDFGLRNMKQLKCCVMGECNEVQVIVDEEDDARKIVSDSYGTERIVLGSLEYLYIYYMKNLRSIWEGSVQKNSLFLLKSLTLRTCPQLTTIFTQGLLDNLCNLEELKVEDCPSIKSIVSCEISAEHKTSYFLPNLKKISLHYMPGLVSISSGLHIAPKLEWLSFYNCPDLKNPLIDEISSQDLKKIKGERSWWEALEWSNSCPSYLEEIFVLIDIRDC
nr:uncharacterized protein LOC111983057 isoform X2 [Quercus suber]